MKFAIRLKRQEETLRLGAEVKIWSGFVHPATDDKDRLQPRRTKEMLILALAKRAWEEDKTVQFPIVTCGNFTRREINKAPVRRGREAAGAQT